MKNVITNKKVWGIIQRAQSLFLMLDFDGTLCPLERTPAAAKMPEKIKETLRKCAEKIPVAIISGRSLSDIKKKVGLRNLIYAGNHGLEWEIMGKMGTAVSTDEIKGKLKTAKSKINIFLKRYRGAFLENKGAVLALHYRNVPKRKEKEFRCNARFFLNSIVSSGTSRSFVLTEGKKVFEIKPSVKWNKGYFAEKVLHFYQERLRIKLLPICIGDDSTDEDIFRRLKSAITIRVGKNKKSSAKYYLPSHSHAGVFLKKIAALL